MMFLQSRDESMVELCEKSRLVQQLVIGELSESEIDQLENHLRECPICLRALTDSNQVSVLLESLRSAAPRWLGQSGHLRLMQRITSAGQTMMASLGSTDIGPASNPNHPSKSGLHELLSRMLPPVSPGDLGILAHFSIQKVLGEGGMGIVFMAHDRLLNRPVALKLLTPEFSSRSSARERFLREARAAAAIRHDHIVTIYQVGEAEGLQYLAQELIPGETLEGILKRFGTRSQEESLRIAAEVSAGLAAAHERGLLHRDIKPSNVMIESATGRVKLLDFGLAVAIGDEGQLTRTGAIVGTPAYMSPEQAQNLELDHRTDLFSLGCLMYRMLSGREPFAGTNIFSILRSLAVDQQTALHDLDPNIDQELSELVQALLSKDRDARPANATDVARRFETIRLRLQPTSNAKPASQTAPPRGNRPFRIALAAGGFLAIAICVAIWIRIQDKEGNEIARIKMEDGQAMSIKPADGTSLEVMHEPDSAPATHLKSWHDWPTDAPSPAIAPFDAKTAHDAQIAWSKYLGVPIEYVDLHGQTYRLIPPGEFTMGSDIAEVRAVQEEMMSFERDKDGGTKYLWRGKTDVHAGLVATEFPPRHITLTEPFYLAINEITVSQWAKFSQSGYLTEAERDGFGETWGYVNDLYRGEPATSWRTHYSASQPDRAARKLSWNDVEAYAKYLSEESGLSFRMPSEAEWEFACRAGTTTRFYFGDSISPNQAEFNYPGTNTGKTYSVRSFPANAFGIFDMHGSVSEWCLDSDAKTADSVSQQINPITRGESEYRIVKGSNSQRLLETRSAARVPFPKLSRGFGFGGRMVLSMRSVQQQNRER